MANQFFNSGKPSEALLSDSPQTVQPDNVELGMYWDDGTKRYRWAHVAETKWLPGTLLQKKEFMDGQLAIPASCFGNAVAVARNRKGINAVHVFGLSGLTAAIAKKMADGQLVITSGNGVRSYEVTYVEPGKSVTVASGGDTTQIYLKNELPAKLSAGTIGYLIPNEYYGMKLMSAYPIKSGGTMALGGATIVSGSASGYCLIQTRGPGIGYGQGTITSGFPVIGAASGHQAVAVLLTSTTDQGTLSPIAGHAITSGASNKHFAVNWEIE